jgi:serine/threonine protein kinase
MSKNNSSSNIFPVSKSYNSSPKTEKERSDSSSILFCNNISNNANMVNISLFSENESSCESGVNEKLNLSRVDSCLSRIDSNIHRLDSSISRGDSYDNNKNEEDNGEGKNKFFLNSNQNFQLGYRGPQTKKINNNKLSLFSSKSPPKISNNNLNNLSISNNYKNQKPTLTLFKKDNKENEEENSSDDNNSSSDIENSNSNIVIHCEEEDENDDNNIDKALENEKIKERKESDADFFLEKAKSRKPEEDENLENYLELDNPRDEDDIIFRETNFEEVLPKILYIDPSKQKNLDVYQIVELFNELMEGCDKKMNISMDQSTNNIKNNILTDNFKEDEDIKSKRKKLNVKPKNDNVSSNKININVFKLSNENKNDKVKEKENEIIRTSKFKLILPIAKGGYGSVGLYKKLSTSDTYAIKTVDINYMKEKKLSKSLKIEKNILKEINNDYVVNSYYIFQDKKYYYFVMEYLPGGDVYTLLSKNNLPKRTIQLIVAETILAVNYLHSIHIIHHDIKPENILITLRGHFKLSDFGLSKSLQENEEDESIEEHVKNFINFVQFKNCDSSRSILEDDDKNKEAVGTLNYMAPELFTDKYPEGGGVDYWAIGVLIFDLYSYSLPFEAKTQEETRSNIIGLKINWNKLINDDVKKVYGNIDSAVDLIKKFLKEDPKERWGDKNLDEIKRHKFFENFNWDDVQGIKNDAIKEYVKERVKENNNRIRQLNLKNKDKKERRTDDKDKDNKTLDGYPEIIEINLTENDERSFFTERLDNLNKKK